MKALVKLSIAIIVGLYLISCSSGGGGQIASFEDLTTESQKEGRNKIPQYRTISIPGLLPFSEIGGVHFYKSKRKPASAIGLSISSSYAVETEIDGSHCNLACLSKIRTEILKLKSAASKLITERIELSRLLSDKPDSSAAAADQTAYLINLKIADDQYEAARVNLDTFHQNAVELIQASGVLVFRWNTNTKKSGFLGLGSLFQGSSESEEDSSGFGLISGLRYSTLYVGNDINDAWGHIDVKSRYANRYEITTSSMQAQYIMYMSEQDLSSSLSATVDASYSELSDLAGSIKALDNIELKAVISKVSNLSNIGVIGDSKRTVFPIDWKNPNILTTPGSQDGWQTIYAVKSDLTDLLEMVSSLK